MRKSLLASASIAGLTLLASFAAQADATYIPVTPPAGATSVTVFGINNKDVIAGSYLDSAGVEHGFFGPLNGTYTTFDFGGSATGTEPRGLSENGAIDGFAKGSGYTIGEEFYRTVSGEIKVFERRGAPIDGVVQGINPDRISMGDYFNANGKREGFFGKKGHFKTKFDLLIKGVIQNSPRKQAESGAVAGYFIDNKGGEHGFIQNGETVQVVDAPPEDAATLTVLEGINKRGQASGQWDDTAGNPHSFALDSKTGTFTTLDPGDGSTFQQAWGISGRGLIAFSTNNGSTTSSYIYCPLDPADCPAGGFTVKNKSIHVAPGTFLKYDRYGRTARHLPAANSITKHGAIQ